MKKIILEIKEKLRDGEILQYKDGAVKSVEIHQLLPDLTNLNKIVKNQGELICDLTARVAELEKKVKELRGED